MESRKSQFKHTPHTVKEIRNRTKLEDIELRKEKRDKLIGSKRFKYLDGTGEDDEFTAEEVKEITKNLSKPGPHRKDNLKSLQGAFSRGTAFIEAFFSVENSLNSLIGILTGSDAELQLEAAWCITNISAGLHDQALAIVKHAAPYLITYLSSSNQSLQDICAWAIGNLAADSQECVQKLHDQGVVVPLVKLLESPYPSVVRSAAFAISNLMKDSDEFCREFLGVDIIKKVLLHVKPDADNRPVLGEVGWILTYLTTSGDFMSDVIEHEVLSKLSEILIILAVEDNHDAQVITPLLRCVGNICSGPDEFTLQLLKTDNFVEALHHFINSKYPHNVVKESLWLTSNMTGEPTFCRTILTSPILPLVIEKLSSTFDIRQEALFVLCNIGCLGEGTCSCLVENGALQKVVSFLNSTDIELLCTALSFCEMCLRLTEKSSHIFEENGGVGRLEGLEYHANEEVRTRANHLLETYFYLDKEGTQEG